MARLRKRESGIDQIHKVIGLLKEDELRNINILNFIAENHICGIETVGSSVLVRGKSDRQWVFVSSTSREELTALVEKLDAKDDHFAAVEDWMVPILSQGNEVDWNLSMVQFTLSEQVKMPKIDLQIRSLSTSDVNHVYENSNYGDVISIGYVRDRILRGPSVAIQENNQLVAWAMTQDDGAMGFLHVMDGYRKKGYGRGVTIALVGKLRQRGKMPYVYIENDNQQALRLVSKLGFERDKKIQWLRVKPGT